MLDASKVCDRVHYVKLFKLLLKREVCPVVLRFRIELYTNQKQRIKWEFSISELFCVKNGVKQGGVLSPVLFSIYFDERMTRLRTAGYGCHVGSCYVGSFAYADDIIILAPTITSLRLMLQIVHNFGNDYCINFNPSKSEYLVFGKSEKECDTYVQYNCLSLKAKNLSKHLGTPFDLHSMKDQVTELINDMVKRFNTMLSTLECCSYQVKYKLFKSYCMSLYGSVLCDLSSKQILRLYTTWRKCPRQLLKIIHVAHGEYLPLIVEDISFEGQLVKRFIRFYNSVINSDNNILQFCGQLVTKGSNSAVCKSVMYVKSKYNLKYKCDDTLSIKELYTELGIMLSLAVRMILKTLLQLETSYFLEIDTHASRMTSLTS